MNISIKIFIQIQKNFFYLWSSSLRQKRDFIVEFLTNFYFFTFVIRITFLTIIGTYIHRYTQLYIYSKVALFISCLLYYFYYFFWLSSLLHLHFHCIYVLSISAIVLGIGFKPIILAFVMNIALVSSWCTLYFFCRSHTISWFCSLLLHFSLLSYSFIYFVYLGNLGKLLEKKKKQKKYWSD